MGGRMGHVPRIVFISGHRFGVEALRGLVQSAEYAAREFEISAVYGLHPRHAYAIAGYSDIAAFARAEGIRHFWFDRIASQEAIASIGGIAHEHLFAVGLSQLLPLETLDLPSLFAGKFQRHGPSHGCIGMHPTLLPIGRGRAPIPWTILRGIRSSGVTAFRLEADADAGNIVASEPFAGEETDTAATLFEKVAATHKTLGTRLAAAIARNELSDRVQDTTQATVWERRTPSDSWLDFYGTTASLLRQIRACQAPYPLAFFAVGDCVVQVLKAEPASRPPTALPLGTLRVDGDEILVRVSDGDIRITHYLVNGASAALPVERHAFATAVRALDERG